MRTDVYEYGNFTYYHHEFIQGKQRNQMIKNGFRLIFNGLDKNVQKDRPAFFFHKELGLTAKSINTILTNPPKILKEDISLTEIRKIQNFVEAMGCITRLEETVSYPEFNFSISKKDLKKISSELNKILRCKASLLFILARISAKDPDKVLPSMMGNIKEEIAARFRESDTVLGADDRHIIIIAFPSGKDAIAILRKKTENVFKTLVKDEFELSTGISLFPGECKSLEDLIWSAGTQLLNEYFAETGEKKAGGSPCINNKTVQEAPEGKKKIAPAAKRHEEKGAGNNNSCANILHLCCQKAHGKIFKRLQEMDPETIWLGLSQMSYTEQENFLARLPFDSDLVDSLKTLINNQSQTVNDKSVETDFEAILHQMHIEEKIKARQIRKKEILSEVHRLDTLPTLPSVATRIFEISSKSDSSASDLTEIISTDPSLTSKLLKIVNSAFYGFPQGISSIRHAIVILGNEEIIGIVLGVVASNIFKEKAKEIWQAKFLWKHSVYTAIIGSALCKELAGYKKSNVFTAGLLHDFGKIFLMDRFSDQYAHIYETISSDKIPLFEMEKDAFGLNHAEIGRIIASNWNLPEPLINAIGFHHQPFLSPAHCEITAIVGFADYLSNEILNMENTDSTDKEHIDLTLGHWNILEDIFQSLTPEKIPEMISKSIDIIKENRELLEILD